MAASENAYSTAADPSGTFHLRERQYRPDLTGRVYRLAAAVRETIGDNDALGIADLEPVTTAALADNEYSVPETFDGPLARRAEAFNTWLERQARRGFLETMDDGAVATGRHYTAKYVRSAESKGEGFARTQLNAAGVSLDAGEDLLQTPQRSQLLARLYGRNYQKLESLTDDMVEDVRSELTYGRLRGENPREVASTISGRVRGLGTWRSELIARTETLRAHNETALDVYSNWFGPDREVGFGVEGANSDPKNAQKMEHTTAGDSRVCAECRALEGATYTIREVKANRSDLLPPTATHPQCRCTLILT